MKGSAANVPGNLQQFISEWEYHLRNPERGSAEGSSTQKKSPTPEELKERKTKAQRRWNTSMNIALVLGAACMLLNFLKVELVILTPLIIGSAISYGVALFYKEDVTTGTRGVPQAEFRRKMYQQRTVFVRDFYARDRKKKRQFVADLNARCAQSNIVLSDRSWVSVVKKDNGSGEVWFRGRRAGSSDKRHFISDGSAIWDW